MSTDTKTLKTHHSQPNIPKLRFPEFVGAWEINKLGNEVQIFNGYAFSSSDSSIDGIPWIKIADVGVNTMKEESRSFLPIGFEKKYTKFSLKVGDIVIALTRPILSGRLKIAKINKAYDGGLLNQRVGKVSTTNDLEFIYQLFQKSDLINKIENKIDGSDPPNLAPSTLKVINQVFPTQPEQQKIATFLTTVDQKIEKLQRKKDLLTDYKKGMMQKLFSQELRFKDDQGNNFPDWQEKKLSYLLTEPKERNRDLKYAKEHVLSVSGDVGCVNQIEFMGRSYAGVSVTEYHVVKTNDVVYTKSPLKRNPYGIIKTNKGSNGIVSTLYAVYRPTEKANANYIDYYFQLDDNLNKYLRPIVRKGAKNDMKVNNSDVLGDPIMVPHSAEQQKIANYLSSLDQKIELTNKKLTWTSPEKLISSRQKVWGYIF